MSPPGNMGAMEDHVHSLWGHLGVMEAHIPMYLCEYDGDPCPSGHLDIIEAHILTW